MKRILLTALFLGIIIGITIFTQPSLTGKATCYAENQPCNCEEECTCGNITMPASYCNQDIKQPAF